MNPQLPLLPSISYTKTRIYSYWINPLLSPFIPVEDIGITRYCLYWPKNISLITSTVSNHYRIVLPRVQYSAFSLQYSVSNIHIQYWYSLQFDSISYLILSYLIFLSIYFLCMRWIYHKSIHIYTSLGIHRLDRLTSGLLVLAKSKEIASRYSDQVRSGQMKKQYLAKVEGEFPFSTE